MLIEIETGIYFNYIYGFKKFRTVYYKNSCVLWDYESFLKFRGETRWNVFKNFWVYEK